ncbi:MAG TPA: MarR family transcriptional regulator [Acidimicrobiales bacterium]
MEADSVDRIVAAWHTSDPDLDSRTLEVIGRLLLCAGYFERAAGSALQHFELTIADFDVLNTLRRIGDRRGSKPSDLARYSLITTGAMTSRLDRLEQAGLIRRGLDPDDRRGVLVTLTPQGTRLARRALHELISTNETFLEPLNGQQRAALASALRLLLLHHEPVDETGNGE